MKQQCTSETIVERKSFNLAKRLVTIDEAKSPTSEAYRTLRTNVQFSNVDAKMKKIMITSAGPGEGKSSTVANLAVSIAQSGKSVLVIDADMRKPTQHKLFDCKNEVGLSNALIETKEIDQYRNPIEVEGLSLITSGPVPPNPAELLGSKRMIEILKQAEEEYDMVIIDTPPVLPVADSSILAQLADGVILVVAAGEVLKEHAARAKKQLETVDARLIGVVLNKVDVKEKGYHYYYYYYYGDESKVPSKRKHKRTKTDRKRLIQAEG